MRARFLVAGVIAVSLVVVTPLSASAALPVTTVAPGVSSATDDPLGDDYWGASNLQSKSKWRSKMLNVLGSTIGAAMPNSWQAEMAANNFMATRANRNLGLSEEQFNAMMGNRNFSVSANGNVQQIAHGQGTYDDYVMQAWNDQKAGKGKTTPVAAPATKPSVWKKAGAVAGGALLAPLAYQQGAQLAAAGMNLAGSFFGFDAEGSVCGNTGRMGAGGQVLNWLSGQDCDAWKLSQDYLLNADAAGTWSGSGYGIVITRFQAFCKGTSCLPDGSNRYYVAVVTTDSAWGFARTAVGTWVTASKACTTFCWLTAGSSDNRANFPEPGYPICAETTAAKCAQPGARVVQPVEVKDDPPRTLSCTVSYTDGTSLTVQGQSYRESSGRVSAPDCPATPEGKVPAAVAVSETVNGASKQLYSEPTTDAYKSWAENFPECGTGACLLDLLVKTDTDKAASCFDLDDGCKGWFEDPDRDSKYVCRYGTKTVSLNECFVYAGLFTPGRLEVGAPYSDPMTGTWSGGTNSIAPDKQAMSQTVQNPDVMRSCNGMNVTGFDPIGFVMRPVQCALEWAFAPRPAVIQAEMAGAGASWNGKAPAVIAGWVAGSALSPSATGCAKSVTLFGVTFNVIDNCPGSWMEPLTVMSRAIVNVSMIFLVIMVLRRQIAGMVGYNRGQ